MNQGIYAMRGHALTEGQIRARLAHIHEVFQAHNRELSLEELIEFVKKRMDEGEPYLGEQFLHFEPRDYKALLQVLEYDQFIAQNKEKAVAADKALGKKELTSESLDEALATLDSILDEDGLEDEDDADEDTDGDSEERLAAEGEIDSLSEEEGEDEDDDGDDPGLEEEESEEDLDDNESYEDEAFLDEEDEEE